MPRRIRVHLSSLERAEGLYYRLRWTEGGTPKVRALGYVTATEAEDERRREEARLVLGLSPTASVASVRVRDLLTDYGERIESMYGDAPYTQQIAYRTAHLLPHLGDLLPGRVTEAVMEQYAAARKRELGGKGKTPTRRGITDDLRVLLRALRYYRDRHDPLLVVPELPRLHGIPDDARPKRRLTSDELAAIVAAIRAPATARLVRFLAWCPRRPIAVLSLTRADCARVLAGASEDGDIRIRRDKGGVGRGYAPLLPEARAILREHLCDTLGPPDARVWTTTYETPWINSTLRGVMMVACERAGVEYTQPYDLRRYGVTQVLRRCGGDPEAAMQFTGHSSPATVLRYAYADREVVRRVARGEET